MDSIKCDLCEKSILCKDRFHRFDMNYCSLKCVQSDDSRLRELYKDHPFFKENTNKDGYRSPDYGGGRASY